MASEEHLIYTRSHGHDSSPFQHLITIQSFCYVNGRTQHPNQPEEEPHHGVASLDAQRCVVTRVVHTTVVNLELLFHKSFLVHLGGRNTNEVA